MAKSTGILRAAKGTFGYFSFHGKVTMLKHGKAYIILTEAHDIQTIPSACTTHSKPRKTGTDAGRSRASLIAQPVLLWEQLLRLTLNRHFSLRQHINVTSVRGKRVAISTGILRAAKGTFGYFSFHGKVT